jgi:hypothetical protein
MAILLIVLSVITARSTDSLVDREDGTAYTANMTYVILAVLHHILLRLLILQ